MDLESAVRQMEAATRKLKSAVLTESALIRVFKNAKGRRKDGWIGPQTELTRHEVVSRIEELFR